MAALPRQVKRARRVAVVVAGVAAIFLGPAGDFTGEKREGGLQE